MAVPVVGGLFAVAKGVGDITLRLISDLRRTAALLKPPDKVRLLSPVGLSLFLRSALRATLASLDWLLQNGTSDPLPPTTPMDLPDSVLIGQRVHEAIIETSLDCLFREGDHSQHPMRDDEVAGARIVVDGHEVSAGVAVISALRRADKICTSAGLPSKVEKTEWASRQGRKVAGVDVDGLNLELKVPE